MRNTPHDIIVHFLIKRLLTVITWKVDTEIHCESKSLKKKKKHKASSTYKSTYKGLSITGGKPASVHEYKHMSIYLLLATHFPSLLL